MTDAVEKGLGTRSFTMTEKTFSTIAAVIFGIVAVLHLVRILMGWTVVIDSWTVPMWVSWIGLIVAGGMGYYGTKFAMR
jgi:hypothetical protein